MRHFLFLILFIFPAVTYGVDCTHETLRTASGIVDCDTLVVSEVVDRSGSGGGVIVVTVKWDVLISANIYFDGGDGFTLTVNNTPGPKGGPGGTPGGGLFATEGTRPPSEYVHDGYAGTRDVSGCNDGGGGGGGNNQDGSPGLNCEGEIGSASGGIKYNPANTLPFSSGFGGGAGGAKDDGSIYRLGSGGGGGGGIYIYSSDGRVTIAKGVLISARGGNGGKGGKIGAGFGGGGGGGSGGIVVIGGNEVSIKGMIDVRGGAGGNGNGGGHGGNGANGLVRILKDNTEINYSGSYGSLIDTYKTDISCGTVATKKDKQNLMFQLMVGFILVAIFKTLFRFPKKVA